MKFFTWLGRHPFWAGVLTAIVVAVILFIIISVRSCNRNIQAPQLIIIDSSKIHTLTIKIDTLTKAVNIKEKQVSILQRECDSLRKHPRIIYTNANFTKLSCDSLLLAVTDSSNALFNVKQISLRQAKELSEDLDIFSIKDSLFASCESKNNILSSDLSKCTKTANTNSQNQAKQNTKVSRWQKIYGWGDIVLGSIILGLLAAGK
jgi:hypothetical protein